MWSTSSPLVSTKTRFLLLLLLLLLQPLFYEFYSN
jgi:hypothetical protein